MMAVFFCIIIFGMAFFGNLLVDNEILPDTFTLLSEVSVYFFFCYALMSSAMKGRRIYLHLCYAYVALVLVAALSAVLNGYLNLRLIIGLRPVLRYYLFYIALINIGLSEKQIRIINILLFALFIVQLPASFIRFMLHGISELTIGTYAGHGGGLTPIIPIVALGYLAGFFIFKKSRLIYLVLAVGFILFGIMGKKRVLFFFYPLAFMGIYYLGYIKGKSASLFKRTALIPVILVIIVAVQIAIMRNIDTLNPEHKAGGGSVDYTHVMDYTKKYTTEKTSRGAGAGRLSSTIIAFNTAFDAGIGQTLLGFGPGSMTASALDTRRHFDRRIALFAASYGKTGLTYIFIEYGFFGLMAVGVVFITFMIRSLRWFRLERESYFKALAMGTVVLAFLQAIVFTIYNMSPITSDTMVPVFFYAVAVMQYRLAEHKRLTGTRGVPSYA